MESRSKVPDVETREELQDTTPIAADKKPNVVFILADNVGYGVRIVGGKLPTDRPIEDLNVAGLFGWVGAPALKAVEEYKESLKKYPNPPASNITKF